MYLDKRYLCGYFLQSLMEVSNISVNASQELIEELLSPTTPWRPVHYILCFIAALIIITNGSLIFVLVFNRRLHSATNAFVGSVATGDLGLGCIGLPIYITVDTWQFGPHNRYTCAAAVCLIDLCVLISVLSLTLLVMERYLAILYPLKHKRWAQRHNIIAVLAILWIYLIGYCFLPLMGVNTFHMLPTIPANNTSDGKPQYGIYCQHSAILPPPYFASLFFIHIIPNYFIFFALVTTSYLKIQKFIRDNLAAQASSVPNRTIRTRTYQRKSLRLILAMGIYFTLSWLPSFVWYAINSKCFTQSFVREANAQLSVMYLDCATILAVLNSAINPCIYGLGNEKIKATFLLTLQRFRKCLTSCKCSQFEPPTSVWSNSASFEHQVHLRIYNH